MLKNLKLTELPWIFSFKKDFFAFVFPVILGLLFCLSEQKYGFEIGPMKVHSYFIISILIIDVPHLWSTIFATYFMPQMVETRKKLLFLSPLVILLLCYGLLHLEDRNLVWRISAYWACWHFVKQHIGWSLISGRKAGLSKNGLALDRYALYLVTLYPMLWGHMVYKKGENGWYFNGDFLLGRLPDFTHILTPVVIVLIVLYGVREIYLTLIKSQLNRIPKNMLFVLVFITWFLGAMWPLDAEKRLLNAMISFSHGIPYLVLMFHFGQKKSKQIWQGTRFFLSKYSLLFFGGILFFLSYSESFLWNVFNYHDDKAVFPDLKISLSWFDWRIVVAFLFVPQFTHYFLDRYIWRGDKSYLKTA